MSGLLCRAKRGPSHRVRLLARLSGWRPRLEKSLPLEFTGRQSREAADDLGLCFVHVRIGLLPHDSLGLARNRRASARPFPERTHRGNC